MRFKPFREIPTKDWLGIGRKAGETKGEQVRQWLLSELTDRYFFSRKWLKERVQLIGGNTASAPKGFFGFALLTSKGDPFLWASIEPANAANAERLLREILRVAPFARLGISTDGTIQGTRILRQRSNSEECD